MRRVSLDEVLQAGEGRQAYMIIPVTGLTTIEELRVAQGFLIEDGVDPEEPPEEKPKRKPPARKTVDAGKICASTRQDGQSRPSRTRSAAPRQQLLTNSKTQGSTEGRIPPEQRRIKHENQSHF